MTDTEEDDEQTADDMLESMNDDLDEALDPVEDDSSYRPEQP